MAHLDPASNPGSTFFPSATFSRQITEPLRKTKIRINDFLKKCAVSMAARLYLT